jgi:hypothetical protein
MMCDGVRMVHALYVVHVMDHGLVHEHDVVM